MNWDANEHYKSRDVALAYDKARFASLPGRVFNHLEKRTITRCFSGVSLGATIADAPCGTGRLAEPLLAAGYRVHGMDISAEMLDVANTRLHSYGNRFSSEVGDVKTLPSHGSIYDAVLCARVLMHFTLAEQIEFLTAVSKLSRSVVVINHSLDSGYQRFRRRVKRLLGDRHDPARSPINDQEIAILLREAGLREIRRYRLMALISEAVYIVAERIDPAGGDVPADADTSPSAAP